MKRSLFGAMPAVTFAIAAAVLMLTAPVADAQTAIENNCKSSGGQYSQEQVQPHFGAPPTLIETCCTPTACTTYRDGVQGPTYHN